MYGSERPYHFHVPVPKMFYSSIICISVHKIKTITQQTLQVSLILSTVVNQLLTYDEIEPATLCYDLVKRIGELFTSLLTETKHRGAFEQVYGGFTRLLTR